MGDAAGIDPAVLAPIRPADEIAGTLTAEAATALGLDRRCAVIVGTGDEHGACVGAGAIVPGLVADVTGTAEPVAVTAPGPVFDPERVVETHAHAISGLLLVENPGFVSGGCTLWCGENVLGTDQAGLFMEAVQAAPGSDGVLFLPALSGATVPRWNDRMRGVFAGLAMNHGRAELARAVIEGCAFALRDVLGRMDALGLSGEEIRVVGGGLAANFGFRSRPTSPAGWCSRSCPPSPRPLERPSWLALPPAPSPTQRTRWRGWSGCRRGAIGPTRGRPTSMRNGMRSTARSTTALKVRWHDRAQRPAGSDRTPR